MWGKVVKITAAVLGAVAGIFGGWDVMLQVLVVFMVVDYISGWVVAILGNSVKTESGHLDSRISWKGILKKGLALAVVLLGAMLDRAVGQNVFRNMAVWFYIANEGLSILENLALAGVPFPEGIRNALEQMREKNDVDRVQPEPAGPEDHGLHDAGSDESTGD
jgi:toxin secretion/phage lysis holin